MLTSVVIWTAITIVRTLPVDIMTKNLYTFYCTSFLMPGALIFSLITGAKLFTKRQNPFNKLGMLNTLNQMLYLLIVSDAVSAYRHVVILTEAGSDADAFRDGIRSTLAAVLMALREQDISCYIDSYDARRDDHIHFCSRDLCWHLHDRLPGRYVCTAYDRMQET